MDRVPRRDRRPLRENPDERRQGRFRGRSRDAFGVARATKERRRCEHEGHASTEPACAGFYRKQRVSTRLEVSAAAGELKNVQLPSRSTERKSMPTIARMISRN